MIRRGILLYSGGLDSLLAAKILMDQGVDIIGYHFILPFAAPDADPEIMKPSILARRISLPLRHIRCGRDYMEMVKNPPHGRGKNINPCIDCKIFFLRRAAAALEEEGASFVATGEVAGQRPMSQMKHMLIHIEKESGLQGKLLRPLSAGILRPTEAERAGIVDREKLLSLSGRGRKPQMELAAHYGITDYASPAGGCLFTDSNFSLRVQDLLDNHPDYSMTDVYLLTIGRHFRPHSGCRFIVPRNEEENRKLEKYQSLADYFFTPAFKGPSVYGIGVFNREDSALVCSVIARYGKPHEGEPIIYRSSPGEETVALGPGRPAEDVHLEKIRI